MFTQGGGDFRTEYDGAFPIPPVTAHSADIIRKPDESEGTCPEIAQGPARPNTYKRTKNEWMDSQPGILDLLGKEEAVPSFSTEYGFSYLPTECVPEDVSKRRNSTTWMDDRPGIPDFVDHEGSLQEPVFDTEYDAAFPTRLVASPPPSMAAVPCHEWAGGMGRMGGERRDRMRASSETVCLLW